VAQKTPQLALKTTSEKHAGFDSGVTHIRGANAMAVNLDENSADRPRDSTTKTLGQGNLGTAKQRRQKALHT